MEISPGAVFKNCGEFTHVVYGWLGNNKCLSENQDGDIGRHTVPPRTTRTDRKSNGKEVRHQVDKKETYIQTSRRGGDGHRGGEDSRGRGGKETGGVWHEWGRQSDH